MPLVKIGPKHQITIPKPIFDTLDFNVGDILEMMVQGNKVIIIPKQITEKAAVPKLSAKEQQLLKSAQAKITAFNKDMTSSKALTEEEAEVAAKVRLIDPEQKWWWTEEGQKNKAERSIAKEQLS
jgi:AbrB family looped-hinge helix DNA binding protein